jgi:hypothetical protein
MSPRPANRRCSGVARAALCPPECPALRPWLPRGRAQPGLNLNGGRMPDIASGVTDVPIRVGALGCSMRRSCRGGSPCARCGSLGWASASGPLAAASACHPGGRQPGPCLTNQQGAGTLPPSGHPATSTGSAHFSSVEFMCH